MPGSVRPIFLGSNAFMAVLVFLGKLVCVGSAMLMV
jgi:hypothetical protein